MFKRTICAACCVLLSAVMTAGCAQQETEQLTPPFWVVEDAQTGGRLYLLGSMHVGREGAVYPDYVLEAYAESSTVAAELDTTIVDEAAYNATSHLMLPEGTTAKDCFGEDYDDAVAFMKQMELYSRQMDGLIPFFWGSALSVAAAEDCGLGSGGTEEYFLTRAHGDGKSVLEIESYDEQYRMMSEIPMSVQVEAVMTSVGAEQYAQLKEDTLSLYEAWADFDTEALEQLNVSVYEDIPPELEEDNAAFIEMMYLSRQLEMADTAVELLKSGETSFMLVGAAHFYIEEDIITLLEGEGYTVTEIRPENAEIAA